MSSEPSSIDAPGLPQEPADSDFNADDSAVDLASDDREPGRTPRNASEGDAGKRVEDDFPRLSNTAKRGQRSAFAPPNSKQAQEQVEALAPKLHKVLADAGIGSRREMEELILAGRVSVNGEPAHIGQRVEPNDQVRVNGKILQRRGFTKPPRVLLYHKPAGEIVTNDDPEQRATVFDRLPQVKNARWIAVGRLDFKTEGLLLLTNDGELARKLELPANGWTRRYRARVHGAVDEAKLASLKKGITVDGVHYGPIEASLDRQQRSNAWLNVALTEGKNREVRKVLAYLGLPVVRLIRVAFGPIHLGELPAAQVDEVPSQALATLLGVAQKRGEGWAKPKPRSSSRGPKQAHHRRQR